MTIQNARQVSWVKDRSSIAYLKLRDERGQIVSFIGLVETSYLAQPNQIITTACQITGQEIFSPIQDMSKFCMSNIWSQIVEATVEIKQTGIPIVVWHLEQKFLTVTITSLKELKC